MQSVPTFTSDGRRLRNYSRVTLEAMASAGRVAVERNRQGQIVCATMRHQDGANPISKNAHMGQAYSYAQVLPSGHRAWTHTKLVDTRDLTVQESIDAEQFVRRVFLGVPLSVTTTSAKPAAAQVVSIETYRERRKRLAPVLCIADYRHRVQVGKTPASARPIEFDSQRRAA